ncbi:MAG: hypothetical protein RLZZ347_425 [Candidatus Parcubacteria bacterium]|jgi:hypothetical protein
MKYMKKILILSVLLGVLVVGGNTASAFVIYGGDAYQTPAGEVTTTVTGEPLAQPMGVSAPVTTDSAPKVSWLRKVLSPVRALYHRIRGLFSRTK